MESCVPLKFVLLSVLIAVSASGCQRQPPAAAAPAATPAPSAGKESSPTLTEEAFRKGMALEDAREVQYLDENGRKLSFAEFIAAVQSGRSFEKQVEAGKALAVMTINPKGAQTPGPEEVSQANEPLNFPISAELPPIRRADLENRLHRLADGRHYTLVSFFFADCVPCIQEIPALNALAGEAGRLKVVSVTFEPKEIASAFAIKRGLRTSIVPDSQDYIDAIGVKVYPTLILVSPEGRLMGVRSSYQVAKGQDAGLAEIRSWIRSLGVET